MTEELKQAAQRVASAWHACGRYPDSTADIESLDAAINTLEALAAAQPAQEREAFEAWLRTKPEARLWNTTDAMLAAYQAGRASLPTQPAAQAAKPDLSGHDAFDVLSQGYPTHPADCRCTWCKGKPAAQATPEPVGEVKAIARVPSGVPGFMSDVLGGVLDQGKVKAGDKLFTHPAPGVPDVEDLRDRLVAISAAVADSDDRAAQAMLGEILRALAAAIEQLRGK